MKNIVLVGAFLIMGCAPSNPGDYCEQNELVVERYQPCVDIVPACILRSWEASNLHEAQEYIETHCRFYG